MNMKKTMLIGTGCTKSLHRLSLCNSGLGDIRLQSLVSFNTFGFFYHLQFYAKCHRKQINRKEFGEKNWYFNLWSESACTFIEGNTFAMLVQWVVCTFIESNTLAMLVHGVMWRVKAPLWGPSQHNGPRTKISQSSPTFWESSLIFTPTP